DKTLTARKLTPSARSASHACGRKLATIAPKLVTGDVLVSELAELVEQRRTDGNLAVVEGTLARAMGLSALEATVLELRSAAASLLSAAVRLGAMSPTAAQIIIAALTPVLTSAAELASALGLEELRSATPELELYALAHSRAQGRLF